MNAYLAAGAVPGEKDPLYPFTRGGPKALLEIAGRPMAQWVLDALDEVSEIERIGIVGLAQEDGLSSNKPITYIPDQGDMLLNALAGLAWIREVDDEAEYALFCSADIPAVTPEAIQWRLEAARERAPYDLDYAVVKRQDMERRFPAANRSFVAFQDAEVCGADMNLLKVDMMVREDFWRRIVSARKSAWRQAALFGFDLLLLLLLRRLTLAEAEAKASERLDLIGHLQISPFPELAMDVDKPHQLAVIERHLSNRT